MRTMRYLLTVLATVSVLGVCAQGLAQQEQTVFQSTSTMSGSGSSYSSNPSLNSDGTAAYEGASYTPAQAPGRPGHIRRDGDPFGGETIGGTDHPMEPGTPIGDVFWPLMVLAVIYAAYMRRARKRV